MVEIEAPLAECVENREASTGRTLWLALESAMPSTGRSTKLLRVMYEDWS